MENLLVINISYKTSVNAFVDLYTFSTRSHAELPTTNFYFIFLDFFTKIHANIDNNNHHEIRINYDKYYYLISETKSNGFFTIKY